MSKSPNLNSDLAQRIKAVRETLGMTQKEMAAQVGTTRAAIAQWEISSTKPTLVSLDQMAQAAGISPGWLAFGEPPVPAMILNEAGAAATQRFNIDEIRFEDGFENKNVVRTWGIPHTYLPLKATIDLTRAIILCVETNAAKPTLQMDDRVIVDTGDTSLTPEGKFAFWNGVGVSFAHFRTYPSRNRRKYEMTTEGGGANVVDADDIALIGRLYSIVYRKTYYG